MRTKTRSAFDDHATYGFCAGRQLWYFGYTLVSLTTVDGLPVVYDLVPAHTDERAAAMTVLMAVQGCAIWADKGFLGDDWCTHVVGEMGNRVWTPKRKNQAQNPHAFDCLLGQVRQRIEGVFNELQHTGRHLERLLAKTVEGVVTRIATKLTHHVLTYLLRRAYGSDILTFQQDSLKAT